MNTAFALMSSMVFWAAVIGTAAPFVLGTVGALVCGRAGVLPLAAEGILAVAATIAMLLTGSGIDPWTALAVAAAAGLAIGAVHAVLIGPLALAQPAAGFAVLLLTVGAAHLAHPLPTPSAVALAAVDLPWPHALPAAVAGLRDVLRQPPTVHLAVLIVLAVCAMLATTPLGLVLQACGDSPAAVAAQGRSVEAARLFAGAFGAALMGLAGASLALTGSVATGPGAIDGRGFMWLALAAAARWHTGRAVALALPFALLQAALIIGAARADAPELARAMPAVAGLAAFAVLILARGDDGRRFSARS